MVCRNTSYLNIVIFKENDHGEHLPKYLFIKDFISHSGKIKNGEFEKPGNSVFDKFELI